MTKRVLGLMLIMILNWGALAWRPVYGQVAADPQIQTARHYMQSNQWDYASREWRQVLAQDPNQREARLGLAQAMIHGEQLPEAIQYLEGLKRQGDHSVDVQLWLARAYRNAGQPRAAARAYLELLSIQPYHAAAMQEVKRLAPKLNSKGQQVVRQTLQQRVDSARTEAGGLFARKKYEASVPLYALVAQQTRAFKDINDYGLALLLAGNSREAAFQFRLISNKTRDWHILSNAALAELSIGNFYRARKLIDQGLSLCQADACKASLYNQLGYIYENGQKNTQARFAYEKAAELNLQYRKARLNQAILARKERNYEQAIRIYRQLLAEEGGPGGPENAELWNQLGFVYELKGKFGKAAEAYRKSVALNPQSKEAYDNLGVLYRKLGKREQADRAFKALMALEFAEMEKSHPAPESRGHQTGLLKAVDIFTAQPILNPPQTSSR
ncbi:MAG TPA: tetratricopeptide repeat protein [Coleofasciculaceae cyanobacterium]